METNITVDKFNKLATFWKEIVVFILIFGAIFFSISAILPPRYKSNASILIIQKDASGLDAYREAKSAEFAGRVLKEVIYSNSFFESITQASQKAKDIYFAEKSPEARLELWEENISVSQVTNTGVLNISSFASEKIASREVLNTIVETLQNQGKNFHGNNQLEIKVISKPYFQEKPAFPNLWFNTIAGMLAGAILAVLGATLLGEKFLFWSRASQIEQRYTPRDTFNFKKIPTSPVRKDYISHSASLQSIEDEKYINEFKKRYEEATKAFDKHKSDARKEISAKSEELSKTEPVIVKEEVKKIEVQPLKPEVKSEPKVENEIPIFVENKEEKVFIEQEKKASAPENLPFADETEFEMTMRGEKPEVESITETKVESEAPKMKVAEISQTTAEKSQLTTNHEPTEKEIKDRLNKLLRGEL